MDFFYEVNYIPLAHLKQAHMELTLKVKSIQHMYCICIYMYTAYVRKKLFGPYIQMPFTPYLHHLRLVAILNVEHLHI